MLLCATTWLPLLLLLLPLPLGCSVRYTVASAASSVKPDVASTPPMVNAFHAIIAASRDLYSMYCWRLMQGWRSWNAWESDVTQTKMESVLDALTAPRAIWNGSKVSLLQLGYNRVGIDEGWEQCGAGVNGSFNDENCVPLTSRSRFPDMTGLVSKHHAAGAKLDW